MNTATSRKVIAVVTVSTVVTRKTAVVHQREGETLSTAVSRACRKIGLGNCSANSSACNPWWTAFGGGYATDIWVEVD